MSSNNIAREQQTFVKFFGSADRRTPRGAVVADVVAESGCNWACTYPTTRRPRQVQDADLMYMGRLVSDPNDIMIFGRATAEAHKDGIDVASEQEIARRPWKRRWSNYIRVHDGEFLDASVGHGISLQRMMAELGSDAFASTQENARSGKGNMEPSRSLMQKPHMRLTAQSREWLDRRFEDLRRYYGLLDLSAPQFSGPHD